jgi:NADPH:quinone reductase-like Zn-dependent oxidoreductase
MLAAGLNPVDVIIVAGGFRFRPFGPPCVAGYEGVGVLADGQRVYFSDPPAPYGSLGELVPIDEESMVPLPSGLDPSLAAALGVPGIAAWLALEKGARLATGETVLVLGAGGSVGRLAVQVAKPLGAGRVVAAARSEAALRRAGAIGADAVALIPDDAAAFERALRDAAPEGYDVVVDLLWGEVVPHAIAVANDGARVVQVGSSAGAMAPIVAPVFRNKLISIVGHSNFLFSPEIRGEAYGRLARLAVEGRLSVEMEAIKLADIARAWARLKRGGGPKLVITP